MAANLDEQTINNSPAAPTGGFSAPTLTLGAPDQTWAKHGLYQYPITFNGQVSNAKAIIRERNVDDGHGTFNDVEDLIAIAGKGYTLLPNEEAIDMANQAAKLAGFVPFFEKMKSAKWKEGQGRLSGHVLCNGKDTQMHAFYVPKDIEQQLEKRSARTGHEVFGVPNDKVYVGVDVVNSIDGKKSFGVQLFSFRTACKNGVLWGSSNLGGVKYAHTKKLETVVGQLKTLFVEQMDRAQLILENYRRLNNQPATVELLETLSKSRIPEKILPKYITDEEQRKAVDITKITKWQLYNDVTAGIWHNPSNDVTGKEFQFAQLEKVMPVLRVR